MQEEQQQGRFNDMGDVSISLMPLMMTSTPTIKEFEDLQACGLYLLPHFPRGELLIATINSPGASEQEKALAKKELDESRYYDRLLAGEA